MHANLAMINARKIYGKNNVTILKKKGRAKIILYVAFCNIIYLTYIFATLFYSYSIKDLLVFINLPQNVNLFIVNYSINRFT